tara:strand:+ start:62 stop:964 length:903 start_codon:yes stop_codon:yes gene_type:complete
MKDLSILDTVIPVADYEMITPDRAEFYLKSNTNNYRTKMSRSNIENLKIELRLNEWTYTTQGIGFDTNGVLVDGQNRLKAIVESGITAPLLVCYNLPPESRFKHDNGRKRTLGDHTGLSNTEIATCRVPFRAMGNFKGNTTNLTFMKSYLEGELGQLSKELYGICRSTTGIMGVGMRAGLIISIMSGKITKRSGLSLFKKIAELRRNNKGVYLNKSLKSRRKIEADLPLLLSSLIEKMHQGITPVYNDKTGQFVDATDVREQASKIMFLSMQAFDKSVNTNEEFSSPSYQTVADTLAIQS